MIGQDLADVLKDRANLIHVALAQVHHPVHPLEPGLLIAYGLLAQTAERTRILPIIQQHINLTEA